MKRIIWKHWKLWEIFKNTLKHILKTYNLKTIETYGEFWKHFEIHYLKTLWNTQFENHWNLWEIFENTFETHHLKNIETYGEFSRHFETLFEDTLKHIIWKPLKFMRSSSILNTIETHYLKTLWNLWGI